MKSADFLRLVELGHLPQPQDIGGLKRWDIDELRNIINGRSTGGDMEW